jgi:hypothetical protein
VAPPPAPSGDGQEAGLTGTQIGIIVVVVLLIMGVIIVGASCSTRATPTGTPSTVSTGVPRRTTRSGSIRISSTAQCPRAYTVISVVIAEEHVASPAPSGDGQEVGATGPQIRITGGHPRC